jgi:hypothetical protein
MKYLIVSEEYMSRDNVTQVFKDDVIKRDGKLRVIGEHNGPNNSIQYMLEGNDGKHGCGYWWDNMPAMGILIEVFELPEELFEL